MTAPNVLLSFQEPITNNRLLVMLTPTFLQSQCRSLHFFQLRSSALLGADFFMEWRSTNMVSLRFDEKKS